MYIELKNNLFCV